MAASAVLLALVTGCTTSSDPGQGEGPPATNAGTSGGGGTQKPAPDLKLEQARGKKLLIKEMDGKVGTGLPVFTPPHASYTVHFVCSGTGNMSLEVAGKKWISHPCDGVENAAERITEKEPQAVVVKLSGAASWKVAVADGPL
ncbi:hypothetical protein ACFVZW_15780 [Streptomyces sp. NPDC059567]|uniref:hypothetical protein n=1 Tax=Streptomyces sp. NPDC059567 TaxID=3346867 RepID=UPI0036BC9F51